METLNFPKISGRIITKKHSEYKYSTLSWNRAIEKFPLAIIYCSSIEDVIASIKFVSENNLEFRIRSGCHHYEGFSTGNNLIVIDVSEMNKIFLNKENDIVEIEAGTRNRELYEAACSNGYAFPGGGCPTVGAVAFTLGGGWGYSARFLGLGSDSLLEATLVNYEGKLIKANATKNSDLFWALKGAGAGNFGVVVSMKFKLNHKIEMGTLVNLEFTNLNISDMTEIFLTWQNNFKNSDCRLNCKTAFFNSEEKGLGVKITGIFYGTIKEASESLNSFLTLKHNLKEELSYISILEINRAIQDAHPDFESYKSTGRFVTRDYSKEEILNLLSILETKAKGSIYTALSLYGMGGNIKNTKADTASFYYRDADAIMGLQSVWEDKCFAEENKNWVVNKFSTYTKPITAGSFVAFPIKELENYNREYYGENLNRLKEIKKIYDPKNLFKFEQSL